MKKYLTPNINSARGHLNQERQGLQSTKQPIHIFDESTSSIKEKMDKLRTKYPDISDLKEII